MSKVDLSPTTTPYLANGKSRIPKGMRAPDHILKQKVAKDGVQNLAGKKDYNVSLSDQAKDLKKNFQQSSSSISSSSPSIDVEVPKIDPAKELAKEVAKDKIKDQVKDIAKVSEKEYWTVDKPAIVFISGLELFDSSSVKGDYDGIPEMSRAVEHAKHFSWSQGEEIMDHIKMHKPHTPLILVGHSFGGDTAVEVARELNTPENKFRMVDMMVTLDSVGYDNDEISENVRINLNYMADDLFGIFNDGPNYAKDYQKTFVQNLLRKDGHKQLDDAPDIQKTILDAISKLT